MRSRKTIATPPGATIREQLEDRGMTQKEFSLRMDMSEKHISKLINGEVRLTPDVAQRLEFVLNIPAQYWNNLEAIYQEKCERVRMENDMDADIEIAKQFPYSEMANLGWVAVTRNLFERVCNLRGFFQVAKLSALENLIIPGIAYRRTEVKEKSNYALAAWAQRARVEAQSADVESINIAKLKEIIPSIRAMTTTPPDEFCPDLIKQMAECGIAMVFLPHLKGSFLHGASFYDGRKIVMALTVRGRDADRFWFSLFHEVAHVLFGHIGKTDGPDSQDEKSSDSFAAETLIPSGAFREFVSHGDFSEYAVRSFANSIDIDPGIVVGRLQNDRFIQHDTLNGLKTRYVLASQNI